MRLLGASWAILASEVRPGRRLRPVLGAFWSRHRTVLGCLWGAPGVLGEYFGRLGSSWRCLGASWGSLGPDFRSKGALN